MTGLPPGAAPEPGPELPPEAESPDRFAQARSAQSVALMEDYVELIGDLIAEGGEARITDIAQRLGVAHPTVTKAVARLKREGLAISRPYRGVFLTEAGAALAEKVRARHRTLVSLLVALGVPSDTAELDAEGMEHHVSDVTLAAFEAYLAARE
ncbi:manganese-binding transcriptional regulator MntR [Pararhodobacter aggregans]|uniref:manganese-binding transcriptional regulator MntR n=1 Tax=Pararhodobacter aggregans TaxID=404875 RepID=UPI003A908199